MTAEMTATLELPTVTLFADTDTRTVQLVAEQDATDADWTAGLAELHRLGVTGPLGEPEFIGELDVWTVKL